MVEDRIADGRRIAQLLASEIDGREDGAFARLSVTNPDPNVEPTADGARAYDVARDGERLARAYVHEDRAHLELDAGRTAALEAAEAGELRVRPKATTPPKTLVFVESGAEVKRAADVLAAASRDGGDDGVGE